MQTPAPRRGRYTCNVNHWSVDIIRQGGWDLWCWVCLAAAVVLATYALAGRVWGRARALVAITLIAVGVGGTAVVLALPALHSPFVGLGWTFTLLSILAATFYLNIVPRLGLTKAGTLLAIRVVALAMLVPMLFEPVLRYVARPTPERPLIFLFDKSGSMSFPDIQNGPTRIQSIWQALRPQIQRVNDHFVPTYLTFDTKVNELKKPDDLATTIADGQATDIVGGLTEALARSTRLDAQVILFSDGNDNVTPDVIGAISSAQRPVNTVTVGSEQAEPASMANVAVDSVDSAEDFIVGHQTDIKATIKSTALNNRVVQVQMAEQDEAGKNIGDVVKQTLVLTPSPEGQVVTLPYTPHSVGVHKIAVWIDPIPGERSVIDNRQEFQGLALDPRIKVLYIEGRVRPEYRELNRALGRDTNVEIASLLRIQQDRFAASGTVEGEPITGMPQTSEEWKKFDVIILGDLDSSFLGPAQQQAIQQRVSDGGGLLMIGGSSTLGLGGYGGSTLESALPVFVGDHDSPQEKSEFVPQLTVDGIGHPAMEGLADWFGTAQKPATKDLPPLRGNVVVAQAKSGAQILLTHPQRPGPDGKDQIVLAVQRYGQGRSAVFTGDTTYLWYLPLRGMGQDSPYNKFWGQLVRWLAGEDVRNRQQGAGVVGLLNKSVYQFGETVKVRAMVRDERGDATRYAQVSLKLKPVGGQPAGGTSGGNSGGGGGGGASSGGAASPDASAASGSSPPIPSELPLKPSEGRNGMYETTIDSLPKGDYVVDIAAGKDGKELGKQELKFTIIPPEDEMTKLAANPKLMADIADATKGFTCRLPEFPTMLDQLIRADPAGAEAQERSIPLANSIRAGLALAGTTPNWPTTYDLPMQGLVVLVLLATEWILRRKWQLP